MHPADAARASFAIGWAKGTALYPVGLTERARLACVAAMRVAEASPQADLTPTLQLGQLEGIWAVIYARREAIERLHGDALADTLNAINSLDWAQVLDQIERQLLLDPTLTSTQLATKLGSTIENLIAGHLPEADRSAWRAAMQAALLDAQAEGATAGLSLIGDAAGVTIDWELAATAAKNALAGNQALWDASSDWITEQIHGLGYEISRKLAALWDDGASRADMEDAISEILGTPTNTAGAILDTAIGKSLTAGAFDTYEMAGVGYVNFDTAGDGRVCAQCGEAEDNNSYALGGAPRAPLHLRCRCTASPADYTPTPAALRLVAPYVASGEGELEFEVYQQLTPISEAAAPVHDGVAIMLMVTPDDAAQLTTEGGELAENLHVTLGYLTGLADEYTADQKTTVIAALASMLSSSDGLPLQATAFATAQFNPKDAERQPCAVVLVQSDALATLHDAVTEALADEASHTFPIWFPHIAIAYNADASVIPADLLGELVTFDRLVISWGGQHTDLSATESTRRAA